MLKTKPTRLPPEAADLRQALLKAQAELEQMRAALNQLSDGVIISDSEGNLIDWNPAALRLHGYDSADEVRQHLHNFQSNFAFEWLSGERVSFENWPISRLMRGESLGLCEMRVRRTDVHREWIIRYSGAVIRDRNGNTTLIILYLHDLTDSYRASAAQLESEMRLRGVVETAVDGILTLNERGIIESVNPAISAIFGYEPNELLGRCVAILMPDLFRLEPHAETATPDVAAAMTTAGGGREIEGRTRSAAIVPLELSMGEMRLAGRRVFTGILRDVSKRREAERRLKHHQSMLRALTEAINDPVYIKNADGQFLFVNTALARLAGRTVESCIGATSADVFGLEISRKGRQADRRTMELPDAHTYEESVQIGNERHDYLITKCRFLDPDGTVGGIFGISREITRLKLAEQQSREQQQQLAHLDRLQTMGHMASGLAHELNQPLGAIANYAAAARQQFATGDGQPDTLDCSLERIINEALRAGEIIRRLRMFVKKQKPQLIGSDLNHLIAESLGILDFELKQSRVSVDLRLSPTALRIQVDPIQITQVIVNLLRNGIEAMQTTSSHRRGLLVMSSLNEKGSATVQVSDSGVGITEENQSKIFDSFFTTKSEGLGMGLSLCRMIVENHGGQIEASRNVERGMTFQVTLPPDTRAGEGA